MTFEPPEEFNLVDYFLEDRLAEGKGDQVAVIEGEHSWTYKHISQLSTWYGQALRESGARQEDRVLLVLRDGIDFVGALFGVFKIGAVVVMVNPDSTLEQLVYFLEYSRARVAVVDATTLPILEEARARARNKVRELLVVGGQVEGYPSYHGERPRVNGHLERALTHRDDPAVWLFSGGTTGQPKAVIQTHRAFAYTTECYAKGVLGFGPHDRTLSIPKLYFGYATGANLFFPFAVGASTVLFRERPDPDLLFSLIRRHRPTVLINVPTMINRLVAHPEAYMADLSSLRLCTSAGEALPVTLHDDWLNRFGVPLLDGLGTAEMWHIFISNRPDDVKRGTLGKVVPGFEVRICDDRGVEVGPDEVGELWVRGGARAIAYWQRMDETKRAFRGEWYVSGDLISRDADGYITYHGRHDDMLKVAGRWVSPREVENCLLQYGGVEECAVVGATNTQGLIKPHAYIVAAGDADGTLQDALRAHVAAHLDRYKIPRSFTLVDSLPRTHLGKVDRGALRALAEDEP